MNWYKIFYFVSIADNLSHVFKFLFIASGILMLVGFFIWLFCDRGEEYKVTLKISKRLLQIFTPIFIVTLFTFTLLPTRNSAMLIIAGGSVGNFLESDTNAREIPKEITEWLQLQLKSEVMKLKHELTVDNVSREIETLSKEELKKQLLDKMLEEEFSKK